MHGAKACMHEREARERRSRACTACCTSQQQPAPCLPPGPYCLGLFGTADSGIGRVLGTQRVPSGWHPHSTSPPILQRACSLAPPPPTPKNQPVSLDTTSLKEISRIILLRGPSFPPHHTAPEQRPSRNRLKIRRRVPRAMCGRTRSSKKRISRNTFLKTQKYPHGIASSSGAEFPERCVAEREGGKKPCKSLLKLIAARPGLVGSPDSA